MTFDEMLEIMLCPCGGILRVREDGVVVCEQCGLKLIPEEKE